MNPNSNLMKQFFIVATLIITVNNSFGQTSYRQKVNVETAPAKTPKEFQVQVQPDSINGKFVLNIINPAEEKLKISVSSNMGEGYNDQTQQSFYRRRLDLTNAEDGYYTVSVTGNKRVFTKTIRLETMTTVIRRINIEK